MFPSILQYTPWRTSKIKEKHLVLQRKHLLNTVRNSALRRKQPAFTFFVGHFCSPRSGPATLVVTTGSPIITWCYTSNSADSTLLIEKIKLRLRILKAKLFYRETPCVNIADPGPFMFLLLEVPNTSVNEKLLSIQHSRTQNHNEQAKCTGVNIFHSSSFGDAWQFGRDQDPDLWLTDPDPTPCFGDFKNAEHFFFHICSNNYPQAHYLQSLIYCFKDTFCVKILFCKPYLSPLNNFIKGKDPHLYLWLTDPDPGRPKNMRILRIRITNTTFYKC